AVLGDAARPRHGLQPASAGARGRVPRQPAGQARPLRGPGLHRAERSLLRGGRAQAAPGQHLLRRQLRRVVPRPQAGHLQAGARPRADRGQSAAHVRHRLSRVRADRLGRGSQVPADRDPGQPYRGARGRGAGSSGQRDAQPHPPGAADAGDLPPSRMGRARGDPADDAAGDAVHHARDAHLPARLLRPFGRPARPDRELPGNVQRPDGNLPAAGLQSHVRSDEDHGGDHGLLPAAHLPHRPVRHELRPREGQHARARLAVRLSVVLGLGRRDRGRHLSLGEAEALAVSVYRIFGSELSPYSVKVRSYFRYKGLAHEWLLRSPANQADFQKYAKLPLVPLVVTPEGAGLQDSTPIIEQFEASAPVLRPDDPALAFLSALIEEYGDEWGNKWMFSYRWSYVPDAWATAERIAQQMMGAQGALAVAQARTAVAERMTGRLGFVGSNATTRPLIEASFKRALEL